LSETPNDEGDGRGAGLSTEETGKRRKRRKDRKTRKNEAENLLK
jgi:hypothetical protein